VKPPNFQGSGGAELAVRDRNLSAAVGEPLTVTGEPRRSTQSPVAARPVTSRFGE